MISYGGKEFTIPKMSPEGLILEPRIPENFDPQIHGRDRRILEIVEGTSWKISEFRAPLSPKLVGEIKCQKLFSNSGKTRILDMPIKMPGTNIRVPLEAMGMGEFIDIVAGYEKAANPRYDELYCYLTVDQRISDPGTTQRQSGAHVDGFQGDRIGDPLPIDHSYIVSDKADETTLFFDHGFLVDHLDRATDDFFAEFDRQKNYNMGMMPRPYDIVLFNAYNVHEARRAQIAGQRTFARLSWTVREFDRLGNTHNPMFDYQWNMVARDFHGKVSG